MLATGFQTGPGWPGSVTTGALDTGRSAALLDGWPLLDGAAFDWLPQPAATITAASKIATLAVSFTMAQISLVSVSIT
ncbi:MAG TPA: hypothetical protein VFC30_07500 [Solirubrobacteraceae bacterium]|nr:hypothetical protein [Solirubrobacteraceae bacterium]